MELTINGEKRELDCSPWRRLLDALRVDLGLTGTKEGCGEGECGACTVMIDGEVVNSCLVAVGQAVDHEVVTIEGLAGEDALHGIQEALVRLGGTQCGICTPGIALCAARVIDTEPDADRARIRELLSGNICRCTGYQLIVDAVAEVAQASSGERVVTEYLRPTTLADAVAARAEHPEWTVLAGGTDLLVAANQRPDPPGFIDLFGLDEIRGIEQSDDGAIALGAATTYKELLESPLIAAELPMLRASVREIGALQIQARGTIGGNLGTSSPVGDTLPVWLALDAEIELVGPNGSRRVGYDKYCTGYRQTALANNELIAQIHLPPRPDGLVQYWRKMGTRRAQSISKVMVAATAVLDDDGAIERIRLGLGAVADRPIRAHRAEQAALDKHPADAEPAVRKAIRETVVPIDDVRSTAAYRLACAENVCARFILSLIPETETG